MFTFVSSYTPDCSESSPKSTRYILHDTIPLLVQVICHHHTIMLSHQRTFSFRFVRLKLRKASTDYFFYIDMNIGSIGYDLKFRHYIMFLFSKVRNSYIVSLKQATAYHFSCHFSSYKYSVTERQELQNKKIYLKKNSFLICPVLRT